MKNAFFAGAAASAIIAALLSYIAWRLYTSELVFLNRPTTNGVVLSIGFSERSEAAVSSTATSATHKYRRVAIEYEYDVSGQRYVGSEISNSPPLEALDGNPQPSKKMLAYLDRYAAGTPVTVHYSRINPEKSYLEIDTSGSRWFGAGALLAILATIALLIRAIVVSAR
jgi:hypothetical protein